MGAAIGKKPYCFEYAAFHKHPEIIQAIEDKGHRVLWLPPYNPGLNPIEKHGLGLKNCVGSGELIVLALYFFGF